jgi:hypothetical protein
VYVFGDFCSKRIWAGVQSGSGGWSRATLLESGLSIASFGEDAAGELYVAHLGGSVHRFVRVRPRLTVAKAGTGAGTVTGPGGLACGASCSVEYEPGQMVTLTASTGDTSWLAGWGGGCGGTGDCTVLMDGDRAVTATFNLRPVFQFSAPGYSVNESSRNATITVRRLGTTAGIASVGYRIEPGSATSPPAAGVDFRPSGGAAALTGTLNFTAGQSTRTFTIPIVNDALVEGPETILLSLHNPTAGGLLGAQPTAVLTIVDDDRAATVQFSKATATAQEFASSVSLTVTRTGSTGAAVSVPYHLAGKTAAVDTARTPLDGTVDFQPGQGSVPLVIRLQDDSAQDGNAALTATLGAPAAGGLVLGTPKLATVTLVDDEGIVQFAQPIFTVGEGSVSATITLTRTGGTTRPTTVHFATGGAEDGATASASPGACSPGADYRRIVDGSLTFNPGDTSRTFIVPLCGDGVVEGPDPETLTLRLLSVSAPATMGAPSTAVLRIQDNDGGGTVRFSSASYSVAEGTSTATVTVLRASGAGNVTVPWSLGGDAIPKTDYGGPTSGELEFGPTQTSASLSIPILDDALVDGLRNLVITLGTPVGATLGSPSVTTLGIRDNEPSVRFSRATYSVSEASASVAVTVVRGGPTGSTVTVSVRTTDTGTADGGAGPCGTGLDFTAVDQLLTFNPGETSKSVTIPLCQDTEVDGPETIGLALEDAVGATLGTPSTATVQITENDVAGTAQFAAAVSSVSETQGTANVLVTRSGGGASGPTVHWTITGGTAVHGDTPEDGVDYTGATSGEIVFALNEAGRSIPIAVRPRAGAQGPRSVTLVLDWADPGSTLGARTTTTLWILDGEIADPD